MSETTCPFCPPLPDRVFHQGELVYGVWDSFPVANGHALLIPRYNGDGPNPRGGGHRVLPCMGGHRTDGGKSG